MFKRNDLSKRNAMALYFGVAPGAVLFAREHTQTQGFHI